MSARTSRLRLVAAPLWLCAAAPAAHAAACPTVHFVVDRSASMASKWIFAKDAINRVAQQQGSTLPLGLSLFPSSGCDTEVAVRPALATQAAISAALDARTPKGSTATATAIRTTAQLPELTDPNRGHYLVLITDGAPSCGTTDTVDTTLQELTSARQQSAPVFTFVVGLMLFNPDHAATLSRLADAGGRAAATPQRSYRAESPAELDAALEAIQARILVENPGCVRPSPDLGGCTDPRRVTGDGSDPSGGGAGPTAVGCAVSERRPRGLSLLNAFPLLALGLLLRRRPARARPRLPGAR